MAKVNVYDVITEIAKSVNKEFDLEVAKPGNEENLSDVLGWIETQSTLLNLLFGEENYGLPIGRVIEIFGDFSHGKSTILQVFMNAWQRAGGLTNLLDSESGWSRDRAMAMGHNPDRHLSIEVDTMEDGFGVIQSLNKTYLNKFGSDRKPSELPILYGWDTIAASPDRGEKKGDEYESGMMYKARRIRQELRRLCKELPKNNATLVFVNQTIEGPKGNKSGVKTTPGGGGIKFWSSQRLQIKRVATYHDAETKKAAGIISECKMVKNKLGAPNREVDIPINYAMGIDPAREVLNYLIDNTDAVNIAGSYKKIVGFKDKPVSMYDKEIPGFMRDNPDLFPWMVERVKEHWFGL